MQAQGQPGLKWKLSERAGWPQFGLKMSDAQSADAVASRSSPAAAPAGPCAPGASLWCRPPAPTRARHRDALQPGATSLGELLADVDGGAAWLFEAAARGVTRVCAWCRRAAHNDCVGERHLQNTTRPSQGGWPAAARQTPSVTCDAPARARRAAAAHCVSGRRPAAAARSRCQAGAARCRRSNRPATTAETARGTRPSVGRHGVPAPWVSKQLLAPTAQRRCLAMLAGAPANTSCTILAEAPNEIKADAEVS